MSRNPSPRSKRGRGWTGERRPRPGASSEPRWVSQNVSAVPVAAIDVTRRGVAFSRVGLCPRAFSERGAAGLASGVFMRLRRTELVLPWVLPKPPPTAGKAEMETISLSQVNQSQHLFEQHWRPTGIRWPRFLPQARHAAGMATRSGSWRPSSAGPVIPGKSGRCLASQSCRSSKWR